MDTPPPVRDDVWKHLERVLASETFAAAGRSRALLRFVVAQTVDHRADRLKEYTIGSEALERGDSFDPRTDPIVRAEASRLRGRLERYYAAEGRADTVVIELPKGTYVPRFQARLVAAAAPATDTVGRVPSRGGELQKVAWFALGVLTVGGGLALSVRVLHRPPATVERVVPLTALPGVAMWPTFSPDGRYVAFVWGGDNLGNLDIYVKIVGSSETRRITSDPAPDFSPAWSPDGRQISFVRLSAAGPHRGAIHLVSPLGGPERKLSDWPTLFGPLGAPSWSPDGRFLAASRAASPDETAPEASGIYRIPLDGGAPSLMTRPRAGGVHLAPALSPDGKKLAYAGCQTRLASPCGVEVVDLGPDLLPTAEPRRLTQQGLYMIQRIAWSSDGEFLVYDTQEGAHETFFTWRVPANGTASPERLEVLGVGAWQPAIAGHRLAFTRWLFDTDIVRFAPERPREAFLASSYWDGSSHFSPDGQIIAFESMRSGDRQEIWRASVDGHDPVQLTHGPGRMQGSPTWSPDGRRIAFDSQDADGRWDVWTIEPTAAVPHRLTTHPGDENVPRWSHDGRHVYFSARRDGQVGVWRIPAEGGAEEKIVALGAESVGVVQESADGETLYFTTGATSPLLAHPMAGGPDRKVVDCVNGPKGFVVVGDAVYYAGCRDPARRGPAMFDVALHRLDLPSGPDRVVGSLQHFRGGLTVSPDERTVLYQSVTRRGSNLMLVEGFR